MADLIPDPVWSGVYQIETNDRVLGGEGGISNLQAQALANQILFARKHGGALPWLAVLVYDAGDRVKLTTGDIVVSTINANTNNPNTDMAGWEKTNLATRIFDASGITQQVFNDKFLKWKQSETSGVVQDFSTRAQKLQYVGDYPTLQAAFDAQRGNTTALTFETNKSYTVNSRQDLKGYVFIDGAGFNSSIVLQAGGSLVYTPSGLADDHLHRLIQNIQIRGDNTDGTYLNPKTGTTTGLSWDGGAFFKTQGLCINGHDVGIEIKNSFTNKNSQNYYRACKTAGLRLQNTTSHQEEMIYGRFCSPGAVVEWPAAFQNNAFIGGAIEGNRGRAMHAKSIPSTAYPKVILFDMYFESNGDLMAGVPAIEFPVHDRLHISVIGGSLWNNALTGITTGPYRWGKSVSFENATTNGFHYAEITSVDNGMDSSAYNTGNSLTTMAVLGYSEPTMMKHYAPTSRVDGFGPIFDTVFSGRTSRKFLRPNEITVNYPHATVGSGVTISEDTASDYGDGSWTKLAFSASGDFNTNYAQLCDLSDASSAYIGKVFVFAIKATADCNIGIVTTGALNSMQSYFTLKAGKTYRLCMLHNRTGAGNFRTRIFSTSGAATVSVIPIHLSKFATTQETIRFANMFCKGSL